VFSHAELMDDKANLNDKIRGTSAHSSALLLVGYLISPLCFLLSFSAAFGPQALGLLVVTGIPKYVEYRQALLPLAHKFATLPESVKTKYENEKARYSVGWSFGKEKLGKDMLPDLLKGNYKNNPVYNRPSEDQAEIEKYPEYLTPNIWPKEVPEMEKAYMVSFSSLFFSFFYLVLSSLAHRVFSTLYPSLAPVLLLLLV
jgi:hypothetical protein